MSARIGWFAAGLTGLVLMTNAGCYYDQLLQEQSANRKLKEALERAQFDLHDCDSMRQVLNGKIDSLNGQLAAKQQQVDSLSAENSSLRDKWGRAMAALEKMAGKIQEPVVITAALPPALNEALKRFQQKHPDLVDFDETRGALRWKSDLLFPLGSDALATDVSGPMQEFADIVNSPDADGFELVVVGHTCNTPIKKAATLAEHKTNWHLSAHRAISVMNALHGYGVSEPRMGVMGYGEFHPIASNDTEANKAKNRRVEIFLVQAGKIAPVGSTAGVYENTETGEKFVKPSDLDDGGGTAKEASPTPPIATDGTDK